MLLLLLSCLGAMCRSMAAAVAVPLPTTPTQGCVPAIETKAVFWKKGNFPACRVWRQLRNGAVCLQLEKKSNLACTNEELSRHGCGARGQLRVGNVGHNG